MSNQPSPELEDFVSIQVYHAQLWFEVITLFKILQGLCKQHQTEAESAVARAILFTIFGAIETSSRVLAASALVANACLEREIPIQPEDGPQPVLMPLLSYELIY